jgi:hypothetical protein
LVLIPRTSLFGVMLFCDILVGAIFAETFVLCNEVKNDD